MYAVLIYFYLLLRLNSPSAPDAQSAAGFHTDSSNFIGKNINEKSQVHFLTQNDVCSCFESF